jgi:hypothetical protein
VSAAACVQGSYPWKKGGVLTVRTYEVRVFIPKVYAIEARTEEEALAKVAALYKELYAKDIRTWIEPLPEPEDCA